MPERSECTILNKKALYKYSSFTLPNTYQTRPVRPPKTNISFRRRDDDNKPGERFLADFELFEQVRQEMTECLVADAALYNVEVVVRLLHDPQPRLVDRLEPLCLLRPSASQPTSSTHYLLYVLMIASNDYENYVTTRKPSLEDALTSDNF